MNIGHPSTKINSTNQEKIRNIVMDIMEQAIIQSNAINALIGRVMENRDLVNMLSEKKDEAFSYADAVKKERGRKRSISRKRDDCVVALIYPKIESDSEMTKEVVKQSINPVNLGVGVKRVKKISKGCVNGG